jgi:vitamin B12/bleomycin/antimicrobial peptide transport system ATP-binding/permease protein
MASPASPKMKEPETKQAESKEAESKETESKETETKFDLRLWQRFVAIAKSYWTLDEKWHAWGLIFALLVLLLSSTACNVWLNRQLGESTSALAAQDSARFWKSVSICVVILLFSVPVSAFFYFVRDKLSLDWRRWLTNRFIESYFNNRAFYNLTSDDEIDNPDQRIADDIESFTRNSLYFLLIILEQVIQLVAFAGVLWFISRELVFILLIYAVVGTFITTVFFGKALIGLNYFQLQREGDFRYRLVRIRENAESIALYQGEPLEAAQLKGSYQRGYLNFSKLIGMQLRLNLFQYGYSSLTDILPAVIIASQVLSGQMEVGRLVQATGAFAAILKAVSLIIDKFDALSRFAAGIDRLDSFATALTKQAGGRRRIRSSYVRSRNFGIELSHVTVLTPDLKRTLVKNVSLKLDPGDSLLIVGASGGGKSSLIRAIAGLWNSGDGFIRRPPPSQMMFLSQRSYMVVGTLRDQLFYPHRDNRRVPNSQLAELLQQVNLPDLPEKIGGFDVEIDWAKTLSLGEQQRIAFARVLLARPRFVALDEATSALDLDNEEDLYQRLAATNITMISISHRPSTLKFHELVLELTDPDGWKLHQAEDFHFGDEVRELPAA